MRHFAFLFYVDNPIHPSFTALTPISTILKGDTKSVRNATSKHAIIWLQNPVGLIYSLPFNVKFNRFHTPAGKIHAKVLKKKQILFLANLSLIHFAFTNLHCSFFCCSEKVFGTEVKKAKSVCTLFISKEKFFRL